ncbi:MAG: GTP-binding protein [Alphaproteobacteria bacterium]|nr:GTP-binding protein [Alphaproteobacteria bacterium]
MSGAEERLPVSVLTGFLGSGKTTLLSRLLRHPDMRDTAVIINEFGEVGLDHQLVEKADEDTILMNSGCLCCTIRGDLVNTLRELFLKRVRGEVPEFRRVVIETTGLADPAPILHTLMSDPLVSARFRLDGVITTVDVVNGAGTLDRQMESVKQAAVADRILLTKTDLAGAAEREALMARLRALNPGAPVRPVTHGEVEPEELFNVGLYDPSRKSLDVQGWLRAEAYEGGGHDHGHDHHHHDHEHDHDHEHEHGRQDVNRHDARISSFCLTIDRPVEWSQLAYWLDLLASYRGDDLLRVKGILNVAGSDRPVVVHGVQHLFHPPVQLEAWPDADRRSRIVFITRDIPRATIEQTLNAMLGDGAEAKAAG